ncbi:MAG: prolipoprotein diacylglyceryl transferase [Saprospiraceae bacterium]
MFPDLSYFFHALFGTAADNWTSIFKTFGFFLVLAILSAAFLLYHELKRKAAAGLFTPMQLTLENNKGATVWDLLSNLIFGFILGFKGFAIATQFDTFQKDPATFLLSGEGNWGVGILMAGLMFGLKYWDGQRRKTAGPKVETIEVYPHDRIGDITMIAAISGVVGAKIFALIEDLPAFFENPVKTFFSGSGLAIYGGLIGGFLCVAYYLRRKKIPLIHVMDAIAPALIIAYGIGRLGCHFSGDGDWGIVAAAQPSWWFLPDWLWAYDYPHNVLNEGVAIEGCTYHYCSRLSPAVYPTPLYETIMALLIGGFLWGLRKRVVIPGLLFSFYLIFNGVERFWIEKIRINDDYHVLGTSLTQAEIIAILLFLIGAISSFMLWNKHRKKR